MWKRVAVLVGLLATAGCQSTNVKTDYDTSADFSQLHRYQIQAEANNIDAQFEPLLDNRVKTALEDSLLSQFNPATETEKPDFLVRYYARPVKQPVDDRPQMGIGVGSYGGSIGTGISMSFPLGGSALDQQAEIVIDFLEPGSQKLLWRGSRAVALSSSQPDLNTQQVAKAVAEILREFPPRH